MQEYPFKRTRRMLSADLKNLEELGCLKRVGQAYQRVSILPKRPLLNQTNKMPSGDDRNVMMRLRAWRPRVEVFLPLELRQSVAEDVYQEWRLYAQDKN